MTENGGITNDDYIKHPEIYTESFATNEIPTVLEQNWNRLDNQHIFFTHRYNVGFSRKVKMTEEEIKAKKFAMASKKENAEEKRRKKPERKPRNKARNLMRKPTTNSKELNSAAGLTEPRLQAMNRLKTQPQRTSGTTVPESQ